MHQVTGLVANVTMWGDPVLDYIQAHGSKYDFIGALETHKDSPVLDQVNKLSRLGFNSFWAMARPTGRGGNSGGAIAATAKTIQATHLYAFPGLEFRSQALSHQLPFIDCTPIWLYVGTQILLVVPMYFDCSIGMTGANLQKATELVALLQ